MRALLIMAVLLVPARAAAQPSQPPETRDLVVQGAPGTWFPREAANRLMRDIEDYRSLRDTVVPRMTRNLQLADEQVRLLTTNLRLTEQVARIWKESFARTLRSVHPVRTSWYETPTFWFAMGALAAGVLAVGLAFGLQAPG